MTYLNPSSFLFIFIFIFSGTQFGCATTFYRVTKTQGLKAELEISPDRILIDCGLASEENQIYMFSIYALDDDNSVLTAVQGNNTDKEGCLSWWIEVDRILKTGNKIYLAGMGHPNEPKVMKEYAHIFPKHGTFYGNGRVLQLMVIANENGACYGPYIDGDEPCPGGEFPIVP